MFKNGGIVGLGMVVKTYVSKNSLKGVHEFMGENYSPLQQFFVDSMNCFVQTFDFEKVTAISYGGVPRVSGKLELYGLTKDIKKRKSMIERKTKIKLEEI